MVKKPPRWGSFQCVESLASGGGGEVWLVRRDGEQDCSLVIKFTRVEEMAQQVALRREWDALFSVPCAALPTPIAWNPAAARSLAWAISAKVNSRPRKSHSTADGSSWAPESRMACRDRVSMSMRQFTPSGYWLSQCRSATGLPPFIMANVFYRDIGPERESNRSPASTEFWGSPAERGKAADGRQPVSARTSCIARVSARQSSNFHGGTPIAIC